MYAAAEIQTLLDSYMLKCNYGNHQAVKTSTLFLHYVEGSEWQKMKMSQRYILLGGQQGHTYSTPC